MKAQGAVFLDRDGTLNEEVGHLHRIEDFCWIPGAREAVRSINRSGLLAIVVTNQAGIARGYYDEDSVHRLHAYMQATLQEVDAHLDALYYCPFHPEAVRSIYRRHSAYRKPGTGMFEQALQEWPVDPAASFVIGDRNSDLEPGRRLGMTTVLVTTGYGEQEKATSTADYIVADIGEAVKIILQCYQARLRALP